MRAHYADAATHFLKAREQAAHIQPRFAVLIDAFLSSHNYYWTAQQALHAASHSFVAAQADQEARLAALRLLVAEGLHQLDSAEEAISSLTQPAQQAQPPDANLPALTFTCFGRFTVQCQGKLLSPCRNRNAQAILRYLVTQPQRRASIEALMELLWPDDAPEVARHKLHVAVSALRRMLNEQYVGHKGAGYLLCDNGMYALNPAVPIYTDVDDFIAAYEAGRRAAPDAVIEHYERACRIYSGPFLVEDLYADWSQIRREQLIQLYLTMCARLAEHCLIHERYDAAISWASSILQENRCDEAAYRQLMIAYAASGRRAESLRQYQRCKRSLSDEMGIEPDTETTALFQRLRRGEQLPPPALALGA
jgi:DNA-binding SARP family transcriptional activator